MILEIQSENSKSMKDSERATLRSLLLEFEENDIMDATVCAHNLTRKSPMEDSRNLARVMRGTLDWTANVILEQPRTNNIQDTQKKMEKKTNTNKST